MTSNLRFVFEAHIDMIDRNWISGLTFFLDTMTWDTVYAQALPSCVSEDNPAKYEVVTAGEYVKSRLEATYAHSK